MITMRFRLPLGVACGCYFSASSKSQQIGAPLLPKSIGESTFIRAGAKRLCAGRVEGAFDSRPDRTPCEVLRLVQCEMQHCLKLAFFGGLGAKNW